MSDSPHYSLQTPEERARVATLGANLLLAMKVKISVQVIIDDTYSMIFYRDEMTVCESEKVSIMFENHTDLIWWRPSKVTRRI